MTRRTPARVWGLAAGALALAGVAATVWRPVATYSPVAASPLAQFDPGLLADIAAYQGPRRAAALFRLAAGVLIPLLVVVVARLRALLPAPRWASRRPALLVALQVAVVVAGSILVTLPADVAVGFFHERAFGFRTGGVVDWGRDHLLNALVVVLTSAGAAAVASVLIRRRPADWHLVLVPLVTGATVVLAMAHPVVIDPLFQRTVPLPDGPANTAIRSVLDEAGAGDLPILVADASRRTTKANAFVSGLGPSRRVVVWDTLLELDPEVVAVVVAHEFGHREHRDVPRAVALSATGALLAGLALRRLLASRSVRVRVAGNGMEHTTTMLVVVAFVAIAQVVALPASNLVSRRAEASADDTALGLSGDPTTLIALQRTFVVRDLSPPTAPGWVVWLFGSHPSPSERIRRAVAAADASGTDLPSREQVEASEVAIRWQRPG